MALKIRLRQQGRTNRAFYRLVVTDTRSPRDGKYVEMLGWYNPIESEQEKMLNIDTARVEHWLSMGAQLTDRAALLVSKVDPSVIRRQTEKAVAARAKAAAKRKAKKAAA